MTLYRLICQNGCRTEAWVQNSVPMVECKARSLTLKRRVVICETSVPAAIVYATELPSSRRTGYCAYIGYAGDLRYADDHFTDDSYKAPAIQLTMPPPSTSQPRWDAFGILTEPHFQAYRPATQHRTSSLAAQTSAHSYSIVRSLVV